jgi:hypothetical protein
VDGNGLQWTACWQLNGYGFDGVGRRDGNWWIALDGLTAMDRDGNLMVMDGTTATRRRWTARRPLNSNGLDGNG